MNGSIFIRNDHDVYLAYFSVASFHFLVCFYDRYLLKQIHFKTEKNNYADTQQYKEGEKKINMYINTFILIIDELT